MKIAIITDLHLGMRQNNPTIMKHQNRFFSDVFFPKIDQENVDLVLHGGDLFDSRSSIGFNTLDNARINLFEPLFRRNMPFKSIVGNHDIFYKYTLSLDSKTLLLPQYPNMEVIKEPIEVHQDSFHVGLVPWITPENSEDIMSFLQKTKCNYILGHFEIAGFPMVKNVNCEHGLDSKIFSNFDQVWSGHFHCKSKKSNIMYLGSPYAMSWGEAESDHGFYIIDTKTLDVEFIRNPYSIFHQISYNDKEKDCIEDYNLNKMEINNSFVKIDVIQKENPVLFDQLEQEIREKFPFKLDIRDVRNYTVSLVNEENEENEVMDTMKIIDSYYNMIDTKGIDKKEIMSVLKSLYTEAQSI